MTVKVPLYGSPIRAVQLDERATEGAVFGVNLKWPDGTVVKKSDLVSAPATGGGTLTTTDDLDEGQWNLYFTPRRAQDAVGEILAGSANVTLRYVGGTSITADLTDLADSGAGALLAITRDGKGRITGTRAATITGTMGRITVANGDASAGLPTLDLDAVPDAGGGSLLRFVRDAWGRITGTSPATTDDLSEGAGNLYFTAARVRATLLTGLSFATSAVIAATDTVLGAFGKLQSQITDNLLPIDFIDGLQPFWASATSVGARSGAAYIQGSNKVVRASADLTSTGLVLAASSWSHLYVYANSGVLALEASATAPAVPYAGTARSKAGDTTRRYVGSVLTDASGNIYKFQHSGASIKYDASVAAVPFLVLGSGRATTSTNVSCAGVVPLTAKVASLLLLNSDSAGAQYVYFSNPDAGAVSTANFLSFVSPGGTASADFPVGSTQSMNYYFPATPTGAAFIRVVGYTFER